MFCSCVQEHCGSGTERSLETEFRDHVTQVLAIYYFKEVPSGSEAD